MPAEVAALLKEYGGMEGLLGTEYLRLYRLGEVAAARFLGRLEDLGPSEEPDPDTLGMEIHEIHPIALGGDPTDEKNKVLVPPREQAELDRFWNGNGIYRKARNR